jgi:drug/metabolite transporter (DMT)-like permease
MTTVKKILLALGAVIFLAGIIMLVIGGNLGNTLGVVLMLGGALFLFGTLTSGGEDD